jgi:hypothetical protein
MDPDPLSFASVIDFEIVEMLGHSFYRGFVMSTERMIDKKGTLSSAFSLIGEAHIIARALLVLNLIMFG